jgi:hypothetical protein
MAEHDAATHGAWYMGRTFRTATWVTFAIAIVVEGYYAIFVRIGDVDCHILYGNQFREGEPYANPGNYYPLGRVMFDVLFTIAPYRVTRAVFYVVSLFALAACFRLWGRIAPLAEPSAYQPRKTGASQSLQPRPPHDDSSNGAGDLRNRNFVAVVATIIVLLPFLIRDLDECGPQILLMLLCSISAYAFLRGQRVTSGLWLAAAATFKATPLLFLPFLCWKREWKAAAAMTVGVVALNLLPGAYLGWNKAVECNRHWFQHTRAVTRDTAEAYPSVPKWENPKHQNEGLAATFARFVETYPPGHDLHLAHPLFVQFGDLPPAQAKLVVNVMILLLGAAVAWKMRHGYTVDNIPQKVGNDWAVACVYSALLSPLCWKQHLVLFVPCVFLLARSVLDGHPQSRRRVVSMFVIAAIFFWTHRMVLGQELALLITSYNPVTLAAVAMTFLVLSMPKSHVAAIALDTVPSLKRAA